MMGIKYTIYPLISNIIEHKFVKRESFMLGMSKKQFRLDLEGLLNILDLLDKTLSKILCKWKQDSVVSLFLYLNSVFKHKHKLIHNQAPV